MVSKLAAVASVIILLLVCCVAVSVYAVSTIIYSSSNEVTGIVNPTASTSPSPSPTPIAGTIALTINGDSVTKTINHGQDFSLTAKLTPSVVAQVIFYKNGTEAGRAMTDETGTATLILSGLTPGTYIFKAEVSGSVVIP